MLMNRLALVLAFGALAGCGNGSTHYALSGRVLDRSGDQLTINHDEIRGFMPAMTMQYQAKNSPALEKVQPGDSITADLMVDQKKNYWLEHLVITASNGPDSIAATPGAELEPGQTIPDVPLVNQAGKTIHLSDFKGKSVLTTFVYTRCPFPNFCPLLSNEFASIQRELLKTPEIYKRTHLVSISLDPAYDTAPVLRKYGLTYVHNDPARFENWDFVSPSPADLRKLAGAFGLTYYEQGNQITHSMRTVLLAPDGTVSRVWSGNAWKKSEILEAMQAPAATP